MFKSLCIASAVLVAAASTPADAATISRSIINLSTKACQAALPAFDGLIRKRPLAIQNEGTSTAFITCAFDGVFGGGTPYNTFVAVVVRNNGADAATVTCTLVDAKTSLNNPIFITKSLVLAGGAVGQDIAFSTADNGGVGYIYPALSCSIPAGVGISATAQVFVEEIGT